jgi:hypothetical protein
MAEIASQISSVIWRIAIARDVRADRPYVQAERKSVSTELPGLIISLSPFCVGDASFRIMSSFAEHSVLAARRIVCIRALCHHAAISHLFLAFASAKVATPKVKMISQSETSISAEIREGLFTLIHV